MVYVNDGSSDGTEDELTRLKAQYPWLRRVRHKTSCGQSAAVRSGVAAARGAIVVTLDGDGQNDPQFIPAMIRALEAGAPRMGLIAGQRVGRKATWFKKLQSRIANKVRGAVLRDGTRDTGCGLKAFRRDVFLACLLSTGCTGSCRRWSSARATRSAMSTSSTGHARMACRTTACGTGSGSASSILPASGG